MEILAAAQGLVSLGRGHDRQTAHSLRAASAAQRQSPRRSLCVPNDPLLGRAGIRSRAWGTRVVHSSGYTCVELGRLRGDQLGLLGRDGLAGDNGRFYPMGPSTSYQARCAPNDGVGRADMTVELGAQPASGAGGGYTSESMCQTATETAALARFRARIKRRGTSLPTRGPFSMPVCPAGDLRFVQYGLLGPDATSVTCRISGAAQTERTGRDGAYLIVSPSTPAFCSRFASGSFCGGAGVGPNSIYRVAPQQLHLRAWCPGRYQLGIQTLPNRLPPH